MSTQRERQVRPYAGEAEGCPDPSPTTAPIKRLDHLRAVAPTLIGALIHNTPLPEPVRVTPSVLAKAMTKRQRKEADRRKRRAVAKARELEDQRIKDENEEKMAEKIAPAAQREPILAKDGTVLYHPRLERDGLSFKRSNPIAHLARRGIRREEAGNAPTITRSHERAAERLLSAWDVAGAGIGYGTANYGERASGTPQSGYIAEQVIAAVHRQRQASTEIEAVRTWLGALWPIVHAVVLLGLDVTAWGELKRMQPQAAVGYLSAALDRLTEFYKPDEKPSHIRAVQIVSLHAQDVVDNDLTS